jgi:hypothetical protein
MLIDVNFEQRFIEECRTRMKENCSPEDFEKYAPNSLDEIFIKLDTGVYESGLNFNYNIDLFSTDKIKDQFESFTFYKRIDGKVDWDFIHKCEEEGKESKNNYGVCDNYQQVLNHYPELNDPDRKFVLSVCEISKKDQPESGGWRWHKWGEYIGNQHPQHEYIYDEPNIDEVYVYHIYEME